MLNMKKKYIILSSILLMIVLLIGVSYAFFSAIISGGDKGSSIIVQTGDMRIFIMMGQIFR